MTADKITDANKASAIRINSACPHDVAAVCARTASFFVQIGSDAVFSGARGGYRETDPPDPVDFYGRTKLLGEVDAPNSLTVRTSIFGRQLVGCNGLVEWLRSQRHGKIKGFKNVLFSGVPTVVLCELIRDIVLHHGDLCGILHAGSSPISKYDLLERLNRAMGLGIEIEPVETPSSDRSLNCALLTSRSGLRILEWRDLIDKFAADEKVYEKQ
jgi:dTDP-4-dehydrorhamnose reductase